MAPSTDSTWRPPATETSWPPPTPEPTTIHSPPPESNSPWRAPTSPREVASSVVASVQYVTSSVRLLFTGCFQCQSLKGGCWRRQEEPDGAWFDCDKLQVEHPYCYVNPVALTETTPSEDANRPNGTVLTQQPKVESTLSLTPPAKSPAKCSANLNTQKEIVPNGVTSEDIAAIKGDAVIYKNGRVRSSLVESFAAKLEADLRRIECDRQRAEGELLNANDVKITTEEDVISFPDYLCADVDFFKDGGTDIPYQYDGFGGNRRIEHEVWKPSELEDVFECYNMAAFYSYGASLQLGEKSGTKNKGEKFEEVFPPTFSNNNNNIKVFRPACESESPLPLKDESTKENVTEIEIGDRKRELSDDELKEFIHSCVLAENVQQASLPQAVGAGVPNAVCDELIYYGSRSFNKLLIFNLVKSVMAECREHYPHSMPLCAKYPVHLVQNRILSVLQNDINIYQLCSASGLQAFHNGSFMNQQDSQYYLNQLIQEKTVENTVLEELKKEMKEWQDVSREEKELKEAISTEIFHDLISDTASLFDEIVKKKFM